MMIFVNGDNMYVMMFLIFRFNVINSGERVMCMVIIILLISVIDVSGWMLIREINMIIMGIKMINN